jgi:hypothetical protein
MEFVPERGPARRIAVSCFLALVLSAATGLGTASAGDLGERSARDLSTLYADATGWERDRAFVVEAVAGIGKLRGTSRAEPGSLAEVLDAVTAE